MGGTRGGKAFKTILAVLGVIGAVIGLFTAGYLGVFCGLVLIAVGLVPVLVGVMAGSILRARLKRSNWSHRSYLPLVGMLLLPALWCLLEGRHDGLPLMSVRTQVIIDAPPDRAWASIMFYEEVKHSPPWLLRLPLWKPLYARGPSAKVGDVKVCYYTTGQLAKRVRSVEEGRMMAFDVIEQKHIENEGAILVGGSFTLEPLDDGKRTRVTLETTYVPLLTPRPAWVPFERLAIHTLHGHVLEGMREMAMSIKVPPASRPVGAMAPANEGKTGP